MAPPVRGDELDFADVFDGEPGLACLQLAVLDGDP